MGRGLLLLFCLLLLLLLLLPPRVSSFLPPLLPLHSGAVRMREREALFSLAFLLLCDCGLGPPPRALLCRAQVTSSGYYTSRPICAPTGFIACARHAIPFVFFSFFLVSKTYS